MTDATQTLADLAASIAGRSCPMAVVDYAGKRDGMGWIKESSPPTRRYGVRDMNHVKSYDLTVVSLNQAAKDAGH